MEAVGADSGASDNTSKLEKICAIDGNVAGCEATPNKGQAANPARLTCLTAEE